MSKSEEGFGSHRTTVIDSWKLPVGAGNGMQDVQQSSQRCELLHCLSSTRSLFFFFNFTCICVFSLHVDLVYNVRIVPMASDLTGVTESGEPPVGAAD